MRDEYAVSGMITNTLQRPTFMLETSEEAMAAGPFTLLIQFAFKHGELIF